MPKKTIAYARADNGNRDRLTAALRRFADLNDLEVEEEYVEQGHSGDAFQTAYRAFSRDEDNDIALLIPSLSALGSNRREVRGRLAALRSMGVPVYEVESAMVISWSAKQLDVEVTPLPDEDDQERNV